MFKKITLIISAIMVFATCGVFAEEEYVSITKNAYSDLIKSSGVVDNEITKYGILINYDNATMLGDDHSRNLEYDVDFGELSPRKITIDANVVKGGRMRIYDDCPDGELLDEYTLDALTGTQTFNVSKKMSQVSGKKNLCIAFDNTVNISFKNFTFECINLEKANVIYITETDDFINNSLTTVKTKIGTRFSGLGYAINGTDIKMNSNSESYENVSLLKQVINSSADLIVIENGKYTERILDALVYLDKKPSVLVIGEDTIASKYGVCAISADTGDFSYEENYKTPVVLITKPPYGELLAVNYEDKSDNINEEKRYGHMQGFNKGNTGEYFMFKNLDFSRGIESIKLKYAQDANYTGKIAVRLDSKSGETIATFSNPRTTNSWNQYSVMEPVSFKNVYGLHDLYVVLTSGNFGNIKSLLIDGYDNLPVNEILTVDNCISTTANIFDTVFDEFKANEIIEYSVDFGAEEFSPTFILDLYKADGISDKVKILDKDKNLIASADISDTNNDFSEVSAYSQINLSGVQTVYIAYEGSGVCSLRDITISNDYVCNKTFNTTTYDGASAAIKVVGNRFEGLNLDSQYIQWSEVSFGASPQLLDVIVEYGVDNMNYGAYLDILLDSPTGERIARATMGYQDGINWTVPKKVRVNLKKGITGTHKIYVVIKNGKYMQGGRAGNLFSLKFEPAQNKYDVDCQVLGKINTPSEITSVLRFIKDTDTPTDVIFAVGVYDKFGKLIGISSSKNVSKDGFNIVENESIDYKSLVTDGDYTIKAFVWNANNLTPLTLNSGIID